MYRVYGTFIFVPGLDLSTSGLDPNTATYNIMEGRRVFFCEVVFIRTVLGSLCYLSSGKEWGQTKSIIVAHPLYGLTDGQSKRKEYFVLCGARIHQLL